MGTGSQTLEVSQNSINKGWHLNQHELEVKILKSVCTGVPWMCVCVRMHTTDSKCIFLLMHFKCPFLKLPWLWVTNLVPFEFIMLGPRNLSRAAWEKIKEKWRDGSPSCKEKEKCVWPISEPRVRMAQVSNELSNPTWQEDSTAGTLKFGFPSLWHLT